ETEIEGKRRAIRLLNPELGLINTRDPIPLYVAASGPRARALTAKLGAGWIATAGDVEGAAATMADMRERRIAAGREVEPLDAAVLTGGAILEEGDPADSPRAVAQASRCDAAAPRGRRRAGGVADDGARAAGGRRDPRRLCQAGP